MSKGDVRRCGGDGGEIARVGFRKGGSDGGSLRGPMSGYTMERGLGGGRGVGGKVGKDGENGICGETDRVEVGRVDGDGGCGDRDMN